MNENFIVIDATDDIVIGGFGNLEGNLGLLRYSYEEISQKMKENNNKEDDIRLVNSLLDSIRELQQENLDLRIQVSAREEVIDKAVEYIEKHLTDNGRFLMLNEWQVPDLLKILKEVE